jgi:hypothetical protein
MKPEQHGVQSDTWAERQRKLSALDWLEEFGFVIDPHNLGLDESAITESLPKKAA